MNNASTLWLVREDEGFLSRMKAIIQKEARKKRGWRETKPVSGGQQIEECDTEEQKEKPPDKSHYPSLKACFKVFFSIEPSCLLYPHTAPPLVSQNILSARPLTVLANFNFDYRYLCDFL